MYKRQELNDIETAAKDYVRDSRNLAWEKYQEPIRVQVDRAVTLIREMVERAPDSAEVLAPLASSLAANREPGRKEVLETLYQGIGVVGGEVSRDAAAYYRELLKENEALYNTHLYHEGERNIFRVPAVSAEFTDDSPVLNGYEVLNRYFDLSLIHI